METENIYLLPTIFGTEISMLRMENKAKTKSGIFNESDTGSSNDILFYMSVFKFGMLTSFLLYFLVRGGTEVGMVFES